MLEAPQKPPVRVRALSTSLVTLVPPENDQAPSCITEEVLQRSSQRLVFTPHGKRNFLQGTVQLVLSFEQGALLPGH